MLWREILKNYLQSLLKQSKVVRKYLTDDDKWAIDDPGIPPDLGSNYFCIL